VTHWSYAARGVRGERAEQEAFAELFVSPPGRGGAALAAAREAFRTYMDCLAIDARFFPLLNVLTWICHALDRHARGGEQERAPGRFVEYVGILAQHAELLFDGRDRA
jgi:hypothetical protein